MANQYRSVLASGGAGTGGDAVAANVLAGKTFTNDNGFDTGTMVNNGAVSQTISAGQSYTIPEGYHDGTGTVTATSQSLTITSGTGQTGQTATLTGDYVLISVTRTGGLAPDLTVNGVSQTADETITVGDMKISTFICSNLSAASVVPTGTMTYFIVTL